ncbi:MAG: S49 family peptidase [Pseudomonadota bacterium]|nr:MAG: S49 family peptidase [Pseudomonadota bacterium]
MDEKDTVVDSRPAPPGPERPWERDLLTRLAFASLNEQRRTRRWGIFFKTLTLAYLFLLLVMIFVPGDGALTTTAVGRHTARIEVKGVIADDMEASADNVISSLRAAFENSKAAGVILRINSPGGSPVQAGYINDEIRRLRELHPDTPLYAVLTDICASGGYYIAAAADEIYADKASLVGSIGVLSNGFGFVGSLEKLGVDRRLHTAGENKGFMDPFSPERPQDVKHLKKVLNGIHEQFIDAVRVGRGDRLKENDKLFSGLVWTGEQSVELGLVDGLGSSSYVARDLIGEEDIVDYTARPRFFEQFVDRLGASMANALSTRLGLSDFELK